MITIALKNEKHGTSANVHVNPTGETEINHGPAYNLRKKLCPNKGACDCGKNELGASGKDNPQVTKRGNKCFIIMGERSISASAPSERTKSNVAQNESDMIHYADLENQISIGGGRFLDELLTIEEQVKLFKLIRGIRDEQKYGIKMEG